MDIKIQIIDTGATYYTLKSSSDVLGRMYDNKADYIEVIKPIKESASDCTMIITSDGKIIDHIIVKDEKIAITSNISQYRNVHIGFSFSRADGYIKNSEAKSFEFLYAQKPIGFVPEKSYQSGNIDAIILNAFTSVEWKQDAHNTLVFKNIAGDKVREIELHGFTQEQADLNEKDENKVTFVQGKKTSNLENDGNGSSPFATLQDLENIKPNEVDLSGIEKSIETMQYNSHKILVLGANGTIETNANFVVEDAESYIPYRTNLTEFIFSGIISVTGEVDLTKEVTIDFGDTSYYLFSAVDTSKRLTLGDLDFALRESLVTGYNYLFRTIFFQNNDAVGFAVLPDKEDVLSLNSDQMDNYMAEGGLPQGQLAICSKVITNGYVEGAVYRFKITYPNTYEWEELTPSRLGDLTLNQTGSMLVSNQTFKSHIHTMVEFETDGMHYGADFVLHPFDSAICLVSFSFGTYTSTAYLDENGHINISIPNGLSVTNVKAHFIKLGD